jgi:hypothetical protein
MDYYVVSGTGGKISSRFLPDKRVQKFLSTGDR